MKLPRVTDVEPGQDRWLRLTFSDGSMLDVDVGPLLDGPVFESVRDDDQVFRSVSLDRELGTVVWDGIADLDPDVLYGRYEPDPPVVFERRVVLPGRRPVA